MNGRKRAFGSRVNAARARRLQAISHRAMNARWILLSARHAFVPDPLAISRKANRFIGDKHHGRSYKALDAQDMSSAQLECSVRNQIERYASVERIETDPRERIGEIVVLSVANVLEQFLHPQREQH